MVDAGDDKGNMSVKATAYFLNDVLSKRPYLSVDACLRVVAEPVRREIQADGRIRHYGLDSRLGKWLRVVTLADGETLHNAFPDRNFEP